jgi:hypothetical protein
MGSDGGQRDATKTLLTILSTLKPKENRQIDTRWASRAAQDRIVAHDGSSSH